MRDLSFATNTYPRTWWLVDVADRELRLIGQDVVDLSSGAMELRHAVRELERSAEPQESWLAVVDAALLPRLPEHHVRPLSFGPQVAYCVERDASAGLHAGKPFRHLALRSGPSLLTPATAAEIGLYFFGRRPAVFGFTSPGEVHGFIGVGWEPLAAEDAGWLLRRETEEEGER